jgi:hypothetical protein
MQVVVDPAMHRTRTAERDRWSQFLPLMVIPLFS